MRKIFVTGIGTDVGKTVVSAVLAEGMRADYWKPIQTGAAFGSDSEKVKRLVTNGVTTVHPEAYRFDAYVAPHSAASAENKPIEFDSITLPKTDRTLIIEGAGGLLVPIDEKHFMIDLIKKLDAETILVSQNYLGSINHTLLSCEMLRARGIKVLGIIFTGAENVSSESSIMANAGYPLIGRVNREASITPEVIKKYATYFADKLR